MEPNTRKMSEGGIEWTYRPGVVYTTKYRGWTIAIRRTTGFKLPWRLSVRGSGGGSIAFHHQFYPSVKAAKEMGIRLVNEHPSTLKRLTAALAKDEDVRRPQ